MNEEHKKKPLEPPKLPPPPKKGTVTDQAKIAELTESVERYTVFTQVTLTEGQRIRALRKKLADKTFQLPENGSDIQNWKPDVAEEMAKAIDVISGSYEIQASNLKHQRDALRRMNEAIIAIRDEVLSEEG